MQKSVIFIALLFFCNYCANSHAQNKIYWLTENKKDLTQLTQSTDVPTSIVTDTTRLLMTSLPQYQFSIEIAQRPSIARLLKKLPNSCAANRVKTPERLKDNIYSLPLNIALGLRLYYKKGDKADILPKNALDNNQRLKSLASLFTGKSTYTLGINKGRSLGVFLDTEIAALEMHNLMIRSGIEDTSALVKMLLKDRIDFIIDYPVSVNKVLKETKTNIELESLEIAGSPNYIVGYVACNKSPFAQKVIEDINKALQKLYRSYEFYQAHARYLDKVDLADFNQAYQTIFQADIPAKKSSKTSAIIIDRQKRSIKIDHQILP